MTAKLRKRIVAHVRAVKQHPAVRYVVEPRNKIYKARFSAASTADYSDGLSALYRKVNAAERFFSAVIAERYVFKTEFFGFIFFCRNIILCLFNNCRLGFEHLVDSLCARARFCHQYHEVSHNYHCKQNLRHVAYERDYIARLHLADVYVHRAEPDYSDYRGVCDRVGHGA